MACQKLDNCSSGTIQPNFFIETDSSDREETRAAFYHGYRSYMDYGFPADELRPLSCIGRGSDKLNPYSRHIIMLTWTAEI